MSRTALFIDWNNLPQLQDKEFVGEMTYDALNRPVTVTQPDNTVVSDIYDKGGLLKQVLHNGTQHITNITYNPRGQRENIYYGNNTKTRYYYHPLNFRLTRILTTRNNGQDILQDLNYSYDSVGNITGITDNAQQTFYFNNQVIAPTGSYQYDALYRLLHATGREQTTLAIPTDSDFVNNIPCPDTATNAMQNYTQHYQYDALGNMLQMSSQEQWTRDYIYATATNRLLKHDAQQTTDDYTYDAHGNMLTMPHLSSMSYDYQDQLIRAGNGTFTSYYNYDAAGNRTRKVVVKNNIREEKYYVNGYEIYRKYVNGTLDIERKTINISDDEKVFVRIETKTGENPVIRYQYDNHLGSACLELDDSGQIISYEEYHPFGTTSYRSGRTETEVSLKRYKYCGKERDEETGLYYYGMRYYAAWLCRFVSVDPLQFQYPELTPFQYASNRPVTMVDLDGKEGVKPENQKVIKTPSGTYLNIPASATVITFSNTKYVTKDTNVIISPVENSVRSFIVNGQEYVAYFNTETGEFTNYKSLSEKSQVFISSDILYKDKVSMEFVSKLLKICYNLNLDPNKLMAVMAQETGETFNPQIKNGNIAVGLIQFTKVAIKQINNTYSTAYTFDQIYTMTAIQQLDVIEKYYSKIAYKMKSIDDYALATFAPAYIGKGENNIIFSDNKSHNNKSYNQNKGLDLNKDGKITNKEVGAKYRKKYLIK